MLTTLLTAPGLLLLLGAGVLMQAVNALRPLRWPGVLSAASFFAGWLTDELATHHLVWQAVAVLVLVGLGGLRLPVGWVGLGLVSLGWIGLVIALRRSRGASAVLARALEESLGREALVDAGHEAGWRVDWRQVARIVPRRHRDVVVERDVIYASPEGRPLGLDVYRGGADRAPRPTLLFVHGGGWVTGDKRAQGLVTLHHMATRGWTCVNINYRLSPAATFPDHLLDVKQAIRWVREQGRAHGCDPSMLVLAGGSAGAHLASLAALTPNDPSYQPGFEQVDTAVQGCVAYYGVYDFSDRHGHWPHRAFALLLSWLIMKKSPSQDPEAYDRASPLAQVGPQAPPFLVLHGDHDTLAPVEQARTFVAALRAVSRAPVVYAELPGAQHAFEIFPSIRSTLVVSAVARFLAFLLATRQRLASASSAPRSLAAGDSLDGRLPDARPAELEVRAGR